MNKKRTNAERDLDREMIKKGKSLSADFDADQELRVTAQSRDTRLISIRLPIKMIQQLREVAVKRGCIGYQQIIKLYLSEALNRGEFRSSVVSMQPETLVVEQFSNGSSASVQRVLKIEMRESDASVFEVMDGGTFLMKEIV